MTSRETALGRSAPRARGGGLRGRRRRCLATMKLLPERSCGPPHCVVSTSASGAMKRGATTDARPDSQEL